MKSFLSVLLLCGLVTPQVRVINGDNAKPFEYQFLVHLQTSDGSRLCGGSLLNRQYILTAAHCYKANKKGVTVNIHRHNITKEPEDEKGLRLKLEDKAIVHPDYSSNTFKGDIAVWKLKDIVPDNFQMDFISLSKNTLKEDLALKNLTAAGWGRTTDGKGTQGDRPDILQVAHLKPIDDKVCKQEWSIYDNSDKLCTMYAGATKQSICNGDSGGPLFYYNNKLNKYVQVGLVSLGETVCDLSKNKPDAFIRVGAYTNWINSIINKRSL